MLWKGDNETAFSELYKRHVLKLMAVALQKTPSRDDAEELVQNSFLKFYQHKEEIKAETAVFPYLYVVLKNQILNYHRKQLIHQKYETYILAKEALNNNNSLVTDIETKELERQIELAIDLLPDKCKNVFLLSRKKNLTNKQIANTLNISENTVEQHIRKALGRLRISLKHYLSVFYIICFFKYF